MVAAAIRRVIEALITKVAPCIGLNEVVSLMWLITQAVLLRFILLVSSTDRGNINFFNQTMCCTT